MVDRRLVTDDLAGLRLRESYRRQIHEESATRLSSAAIGTATHLVMQRLDLTAGLPTLATIKALIQELVAEQLIDDKIAPLISVDKIVRFFTDSPLGKQMVRHADTLQREVPFSLLLDANGYTARLMVTIRCWYTELLMGISSG